MRDNRYLRDRMSRRMTDGRTRVHGYTRRSRDMYPDEREMDYRQSGYNYADREYQYDQSI